MENKEDKIFENIKDLMDIFKTCILNPKHIGTTLSLHINENGDLERKIVGSNFDLYFILVIFLRSLDLNSRYNKNSILMPLIEYFIDDDVDFREEFELKYIIKKGD